MNRAIVIAAATGIVEYNNPALLHTHGGPVVLGKKWADSLLGRMGLVKQKATKAVRKLPDDFADVTLAFLERVASIAKENCVPFELVINWDQTGSRFAPASHWTPANEGAKQVDVIGVEDKREMTVLLAISLAGKLLPPQLLHAGKTVKCHPTVDFPAGWDVWHSQNHWSTEETMIHYIEEVIAPYFRVVRKSLGLSENHSALAVFDVFAAHRSQIVLDTLDKYHIKYFYVPAGCTGELQPLDLTFNEPFKREMKECFTRWYASLIKKDLDQGKGVGEVKPDLRTSTVKPIHARWLMEVHSKLSKNSDLIISGLRRLKLKILL